jgi:hypothetical protein
VDVVVGPVDGAGDVTGVPFRALAHVEHLQLAVFALPATVHVGERESFGLLNAALFLSPRGHATGQVAGDVGDADRGGQRDGLARVLVIAPDDQDRGVGIGQPREL